MPELGDQPRRSAALRQALVVLVVCLVVGGACGWLWHRLWSPAATGFAYQGVPHFENDEVFGSIGLYLLVAVSAGFLVGLLITWLLEADEVVTLLALALGSLAAGWLMAWVGGALGPSSMYDAARGADDFAEIRASLEAGALTPWVAFPGGALLGAVVVLVMFQGRNEREEHRDDQQENQRWEVTVSGSTGVRSQR